MPIVLDGTTGITYPSGAVTAAGITYASGLIGSAPGVGNGQTWQSVTRTSGVTYTNTTGRPIVFNASSTGNGQSIYITVSGTIVSYGLNNGTFVGITAVIPTGATYVLTYNASIQYPVELR